MSVYIRFVQLLHDGVNFHIFRILGLLLLGLLGSIQFNVMVDAGSLVGLIFKTFIWIFSHDGGVFSDWR